MPSEVVRVDGALLRLAKAAGETMGRSAGSQISHWARLGRAIESADVPTSAIHAVLARQQAFDDLDDEDQKAVAALWDRDMSQRIASLDLAAEFAASGAAYAELDEDGNVVEVPASAPALKHGSASTRPGRGSAGSVKATTVTMNSKPVKTMTRTVKTTSKATGGRRAKPTR